ASIMYGQYQRGAEFTFTDPYLLGDRIAGGFSLYAKEQLQNSYQSYNVSTVGGSLLSSLPVTDDLSLGVRYSLFQRTPSAPSGWADSCRTLANGAVYPVDAANVPCSSPAFAGGGGLAPGQHDAREVSPAIKQALGSTLTSSIGYSLVYKTLDNNRNPTSGIYTNFSQDYAGLGGDSRYLRSAVDSRYYQPVVGDAVGMIRTQAGMTGAAGNGGQLPILDQFFKGPELVRGFAPAGIGPRDLGSQNVDALGGSQYWATTAELQFPLSFLPSELGLKAAVFADAGSLWGYKGGTTFSSNPSYGTGAGHVACPAGTTGAKYNVEVLLAD